MINLCIQLMYIERNNFKNSFRLFVNRNSNSNSACIQRYPEKNIHECNETFKLKKKYIDFTGGVGHSFGWFAGLKGAV